MLPHDGTTYSMFKTSGTSTITRKTLKEGKGKVGGGGFVSFPSNIMVVCLLL